MRFPTTPYFRYLKSMSRTFLSAILLAICASASADDNAPGKTGVEPSIKTISPVFGQLVMFSLPKGFATVFENTAGGQYIREAVPAGESVEKWSQMITLTGTQGLASNPNATPAALANMIAGGFKKACPDSFSATGLGAVNIGRHEAFLAVVSCGTISSAGEPHSESALLVAIKGESDYYTLQWAERGGASAKPIEFDQAKWGERLKRLAPIKLCPIVPGEPAPYPSCIGG
jgi:hypothetical protein